MFGNKRRSSSSITAPLPVNSPSSRWQDAYSKIRRKNYKDFQNGYMFERKPPMRISPTPPPTAQVKTNPIGSKPTSTGAKQAKSHPPVSTSTSFSSTSPASLSGVKMFDFDEKSVGTAPDKTKSTDDTDKCVMGLSLACVVVLPLSIITVLIGMGTPFWFSIGTGTLGLFQICYDGAIACEVVSSYTTTVSTSATYMWRVVTSLTVVGDSLFLVALLLLCIYMSCTRIDGKKICCGVVICFILLIGAGCVISGIALTISLHSDLGQSYTLQWSFYLTAVGGGIGFVAFILFAIHVCLMVIG